MSRPPKAREALLSAYRDLVALEGERAATLEAVAARAGVSKGGLLYHFGSKEALLKGLLEAFRADFALDRELMAADPEGPSRYFVRTSLYTGTELDRLFVAVLRLAQGGSVPAREALAATERGWHELVRAEVGDTATATAIMLMGEGLYQYSSYSGARPEADFGTSLDEVLAVVDRLTGRRS